MASICRGLARFVTNAPRRIRHSRVAPLWKTRCRLMRQANALLDTWPGHQHRSPALTDPFYLHLAAISQSLAAARDRHVKGAVDILDVGCGNQPYYPIFAPVAREYVGTDIAPGERIQYVCPAEELSAPDAAFDVVLATQVLEHVEDPHRSLTQMCRVSRPGGIVMFTVPGVWPYHPTPNDYWRWTHPGLEELVSGVDTLELVEIIPHGSTPLRAHAAGGLLPRAGDAIHPLAPAGPSVGRPRQPLRPGPWTAAFRSWIIRTPTR